MIVNRIEYANSYPVQIFIAGSYCKAKLIAQKFCDEVGGCVTVSKTTYVYTGGKEKGVIVGFINYPRFPNKPDEIETKANRLAELLLKGLNQQSYSIQTPDETKWVSYRPEDVDQNS